MGDAAGSKNAITLRSVVTVTIASVAYLLVSVLLVGYKSDQLVLIGLFNTLYYASTISRKFVLGFSIFIVYWIIFDYMKAFPNYRFHAVHIADLYQAEKNIFGIHYQNSIITPNEYWNIKSTTFLDIATGIFYLCWIPVPLGFAAYLFFTRKKDFLLFSLTFVVVNLLGFVVYYTYPAAPPWYVQQYGFKFTPLTIGSTAGLHRFDDYFHAGIFKSIYTKGSNVFAAMPSLHSSYPIIVFYYSVKNRLKVASVIFAIVMTGIWFTAVYASHHYTLDVLAGIITAVLGINLFNLLYKKTTFLHGAVNRYHEAIR